MTPWKRLVPVFLLGLLIGGFVGARCQRASLRRSWQKGFDTERLLKRLDRELGLDAGQEAAVKAIVERRREKLAAVRRETMARFDAARKELHAEIEPLLDPGQKEKLAAMAQRWEARHRPPPKEGR